MYYSIDFFLKWKIAFLGAELGVEKLRFTFYTIKSGAYLCIAFAYFRP
jgi:hypothetical protein